MSDKEPTPFQICLEHVNNIQRVLTLSIRGISQLQNAGAIGKAIINSSIALEQPLNLEEAEYYRAKLNELAELAKEEVADGFPILIGHSLVAIWASLETMISDHVARQIQQNENLLEKDIFKSIKIELAVYERLEKEDRIQYLINEITRKRSVDLKNGVDKFESQLEIIDQSSEVNKHLKETLYKLSKLRNLVAHRNGIVDGRFKKECYWKTCEKGSKFKITYPETVEYSMAALAYVMTVAKRNALSTLLRAFVTHPARRIYSDFKCNVMCILLHVAVIHG
jgi:hypothetical protein